MCEAGEMCCDGTGGILICVDDDGVTRGVCCCASPPYKENPVEGEMGCYGACCRCTGGTVWADSEFNDPGSALAQCEGENGKGQNPSYCGCEIRELNGVWQYSGFGISCTDGVPQSECKQENYPDAVWIGFTQDALCSDVDGSCGYNAINSLSINNNYIP